MFEIQDVCNLKEKQNDGQRVEQTEKSIRVSWPRAHNAEKIDHNLVKEEECKSAARKHPNDVFISFVSVIKRQDRRQQADYYTSDAELQHQIQCVLFISCPLPISRMSQSYYHPTETSNSYRDFCHIKKKVLGRHFCPPARRCRIFLHPAAMAHMPLRDDSRVL